MKRWISVNSSAWISILFSDSFSIKILMSSSEFKPFIFTSSIGICKFSTLKKVSTFGFTESLFGVKEIIKAVGFSDVVPRFASINSEKLSNFGATFLIASIIFFFCRLRVCLNFRSSVQTRWFYVFSHRRWPTIARARIAALVIKIIPSPKVTNTGLWLFDIRQASEIDLNSRSDSRPRYIINCLWRQHRIFKQTLIVRYVKIVKTKVIKTEIVPSESAILPSQSQKVLSSIISTSAKFQIRNLFLRFPPGSKLFLPWFASLI